jgi:hypothetical protein
MSALSISVPYPVFSGQDGLPLDNGYVWIGTANLYPITNQIVVYFDEALTIQATQPLRTINGFISNAGTPAQVYVDAVNFSILVQDSKGSMVYNFPDGTGIEPLPNDSCGISYTAPFAGSVTLPVCEKLAQTVNIKDFGAVCDGLTNDANALISALATGQEVIIPENSFVSLSANQVQTFVENLNLVSPEQVTEFLLPSGDYAISTQVEVTNPNARNIIIKGDVKPQVSCTAISQVGGSAKNYAIQYTLTDASNVAVGDYIYVGFTTGTGNYNVAEGVWKVTGRSASNVTVKHTLNAAWPTITVTSARVIPLKTILRWPKTQRGLAISGCQLRSLENIVLASQFDISVESPVDSYSDGLQVGTVSDYLNTGSFESQQTNAGAIWLKNVGIVEWEGNGVQTIGGNAYFFQAAACSNGWRGFQAARNGSIGAKFCAAIGNGASGFQAEGQGFMEANGGVAAGNHDQGCYVIGSGSVSFLNGFALLNVEAGLDARNYGTILADGAKVDGNGTFGCYSTAGNILFGASAVTANNTTKDVQCVEGGIVNGTGASSLGVVNVDHNSGSQVIDTDGDLIYSEEITLEKGTSFAKITVTSIGDIIFSSNPSGVGFVDLVRIKGSPAGTTFPNADNTASLGRVTERWTTVFAVTGTINTSDKREKQEVRSLSQAEKAVAINLKSLIRAFKFNDAVDLKGEKARIHFGVVAQDIKTAFEAEGLIAENYGMFCYDEWQEEPEIIEQVLDKDGYPTGETVIVQNYKPAGNRYGVRYEEFLAFVVAAL